MMAWRKILVSAAGIGILASTAIAGQVDTKYYKKQSDVAKEYRKAKPSFDTEILAALARPDTPRHLRYDEDVQAKLIDMETLNADSGYSIKRCDLMPSAKVAAVALVTAANADAANKGFRLYTSSCFRSIDEQVPVFCNRRTGAGKECLPMDARIKASAPPGYSEHATGYTIDFIVRRPGDTDRKNLCTEDDDKEPCGAEMNSVTGRWLLKNAVGKGFELSFPCAEFETIGTKQKCLRTMQGVMYEPWHWRWVGTGDQPRDQADAARKVFATARKCFPADPSIAPFSADPETAQPISCPAPLGE